MHDLRLVWTPQKFAYPHITPCTDALRDVKPIPYRPFRWGQYHVTMGIRTMPWSEWIELDSEFTTYHRIRDFRLRTCGKNVLEVLPTRENDASGSVTVVGGAQAAKELAYELAEYLPRRYPSSFRIERLPSSAAVPSIGDIPLSWDGMMPVRTIEVVETGITYDLGVLEGLEGVRMGEEALRVVNGLTQDDFTIMIEGSDGKYYFQAGLVCVPGFWRMRDKIGMSLDEIHLSGDVPQFKEKLQLSMNRFFKRLPLDKPVVSYKYSIQAVKPPKPGAEPTTEATTCFPDSEETEVIDPNELGWALSHNGPEDAFADGRGHGTRPISHLSPSTLRLRTERQTLRRLPRTGAVVFGIRTYQVKVEQLVQERTRVAGRLASAVRSWPEDVAAYKGRERWEAVLLEYLDGWSRQEGEGGSGVCEEKGGLPYPY
ncbi:hypothetical protein ID866_5889 [Astraeus odoratus]|nr:hypothetical protein ID866_5889 [Astraeus odoratus]